MRNTSRTVTSCWGLLSIRIGSPSPTSPSDTIRRYAPGRSAAVKRRRKRRVVHAHAEAPARDARFGHLEDGRADRPSLAHERPVDVDAFGREVLSELGPGKRAPDLLLPPAGILDRVRVDRLVGTAVRLAIRLVVTGEIDPGNRDAAGNRRLPDRAAGRTAVVLEHAGAADADGKDLPED